MSKRTRTAELESQTHERFPTHSASDPGATRKLAVEAARLAQDDKCTDIALLDVRGICQVADYILICSGSSDRQMRTTAQEIGELAQEHGYPPFRQSVDDRTTWIVVDCVDIVVHIFEPDTRAHYDLEMLWSDAPRVEWERPGEANRDRAGLR
ncbi:MAG: ribosome silencing factor [Phycisphaerales bacterium]|nr:ribosome silencing factor [Phycisphaerales bacterium]